MRPGTRSPASWGLPAPRWVRLTLWGSLSAVTLYVGGWLLAGWWRADYDPQQQAISELFELGAPGTSRWMLVAGLLASGVAFLALAPALHRTLPGHGRTGPVLVAVAGIGTLGVVAAPCTPGCPGAATSTLDLWHSITAGVGYSALVAAPLAFAWRLRVAAPVLAVWSACIGGTAAVLFAVHTLGVDLLDPGAAQRLFNTVADAWYVLVVVWILVRDAMVGGHVERTEGRARGVLRGVGRRLHRGHGGRARTPRSTPRVG